MYRLPYVPAWRQAMLQPQEQSRAADRITTPSPQIFAPVQVTLAGSGSTRGPGKSEAQQRVVAKKCAIL